MIETSSTFRAPSLLSPRTANYVAALIRQGDNFDYFKWLQRVREEEISGETDPGNIYLGQDCRSGNRPSNRHNGLQECIPKLGPGTDDQSRAVSKARSHHEPRNKTPKARLRRRLEKIRDAWDAFQASRARDAVYGYLEAVFAIVEHYRTRRRTNKLLRHAFKFANLPFAKNADPFTVVIRCTCGDEIDIKTISKWARALRYVAHCKRQTPLKAFMKEAGGVNACAALYARLVRCSVGTRFHGEGQQ